MRKKRQRQQVAELSEIAGYFDAAFYLERNEDVALSGMDPALHYIQFGWKERRAPNAWFDGHYYLDAYPDVEAGGINPLLHYIRHGREEGRITARPASALPSKRPHPGVRQVIETTQPMREVAKHYLRTSPDVRLRPEDLVARFVEGAPEGLVLSLSHDDYAVNFGGIQRLIESEAEQFNATGWRYIHAFPSQTLPILSDNVDPASFFYNIRVDGLPLGAVSAADLTSTLHQASREGFRVEMLVHHLMGHAPEIVSEMCRTLPMERPYIWIHDFYSLCESYNLLRNGWSFCNAPQVESGACRICVHGADRPAHLARMERFFSSARPRVIAPSKSALDVWTPRGLAHHGTHVAPIAQIVTSETQAPVRDRSRLRIAFIGRSIHAKGWTSFLELVDHCRPADFLEFYHLGEQEGDAASDPRIRFVPVRAGRADRDAMPRTLMEQSIDIVVMCTAWPETFCYAAHEALAAGSAIVTCRGAGNIPSVIETYAPAAGLVLNTQAELLELFSSHERLIALCAQPPRLGVLLPYENSAHAILRPPVAQAVPVPVKIEMANG